MRKGKFARNAGIFIFAAFICLAIFWVLSVNNVLGKFVPEEPYVTGASESMSSVVVTNEGGNQKGSQGSGATPMNGVPTALGQKGSETNPFVLLEIVPEHEQQQMVYLNTSDSEYPLDVMQIGIDASTKENKNFIEFKDVTNFGLHNSPGEWFCRYTYDVYKFGEDEETESKPLVEIDKVYKLELTNENISEAGYDLAEFENVYKAYKEGKYKMTDLKNQFPKLFARDTTKSKNSIRNIAIEDDKNWDVQTKKEGTIQHKVTFTSENLDLGQYYFNTKDVVKNHPEIFREDSAGKKVSDDALSDLENWEGKYIKTDQYDYKVQTEDIASEDYDDYEKGKMSVTELIEKYPSLFQKDKDGKQIKKSCLKMDDWKVQMEKRDEKHGEVLKSGYLHYVGDDAKGEYEFADNQHVANINGTVVTLKESENGHWEYLDTLPAEATEGVEDEFWWKRYSTEYYWSVDVVEKVYSANDPQKVVMLSDVTKYIYTFTLKKDVHHYEFSYNGGEISQFYSFEYYGLKTNDILKRSLFTFQSEEECNDFNFRVIAMTPSEINQAVQGDTSETLDIIERADMFYVGAYDSKTDNIKQIYELYHKFIKKDNSYVFSSDAMKSFYENDLGWASCYKILYRLCNNPNLPLMLTQLLGQMVNEGVDGTDNTHMYVTENDIAKHIHAKGSLNNMAKLYLITIQFDMLARKDSGGYKRTFYEDILPMLESIDLNSEAMKKADNGTASTTGYYKRKLVETDCDNNPLSETNDEKKDDKWKTCYYLWNMWTFYPSDIMLSSGNQVAADRETYIEYGYLDSFFDSNADPFHDGVADHHSGSDGYDGKNVGIVHGGSNSDVNHSTLIGGAESSSILNNTMNVAYQIMNKQTPKPDALQVRVERLKKDYQRMSNDIILVDYDRKADYKDKDKTLFVKLTISNLNNEDGILNSIELVKDESDNNGIKLVPRKTKKNDTELKVESIKDINNANPESGYRVPANGELTIYVPYQLADWCKGNTMLRLVTRGRKFVIKKSQKISSLGEKHQSYVTISERTLFNLE